MAREEIKPLRFTDDQGCLQFLPRPDVTPVESVLLAQMFSRMVLGMLTTGALMDFRAYIRHNMLERHFEEAHDTVQ